MPYNTAPMPRPEEITGTSALPLARVKKIIAQDEDIAQCSNGAAFAISVATEEFLRYLAEQAHNVAKSDSKPRRNIAYKDIATAVAKFDNLQFLSDTVPKTMTYKQIKEKKAATDASKATAAANGDAMEADGEADATAATNGQRSIASMMAVQSHDHAHTNGTTNGPPTPTRHRQSHSMANSPIVDRTVQHQQNGHAHPTEDGNDVEMQD